MWKRVGANLGGLGAGQGRLGTNQSRLCALPTHASTGDRLSLDSGRILDVWLVGGRKLEIRSRLVERDLLDVSSFLGVVECLLAHIPGGLLTVDPRLGISEHLILALVPDGASLSVVILYDLLAIDAQLLSVADELLPFTESLLEIGQALFAGELTLA
jgi:hypothetical protein